MGVMRTNDFSLSSFMYYMQPFVLPVHVRNLQRLALENSKQRGLSYHVKVLIGWRCRDARLIEAAGGKRSGRSAADTSTVQQLGTVEHRAITDSIDYLPPPQSGFEPPSLH
jgi:hypothetical protein